MKWYFRDVSLFFLVPVSVCVSVSYFTVLICAKKNERRNHKIEGSLIHTDNLQVYKYRMIYFALSFRIKQSVRRYSINSGIYIFLTS